jgi:hypothetical protein
MSLIVGVHGIGQQFKGENLIRAEWLPALKDGLARAGLGLESDDDFVCAYYGDLFRPGAKAALDLPLSAADVRDGWEVELLEQWWREAARTDPRVLPPDARTKIGVPNFVQRALDALSQSKFFVGLAERALIYDLKQVRLYLNDAKVRAEALARVEKTIGPDTKSIIGHSLGSVVAYEALCAHPEWPVRSFVTIGSPLGITNLIFDRLQPNPQNGVGAWPGRIVQWVNIADRSDVVALVKELAKRFGHKVTDFLVDNGARAHDASRYLTTRELGDAVAFSV